ncbi:MAG: hypothetical protein M1830_005568 [Pleopsidium flavum]|nr:MAG: hypothetical protein M1830_005568 [Pleopsidium flavum]
MAITSILQRFLISAVALATVVPASPYFNRKPFHAALNERATSDNSSSLVVDLGYELYRGVANSSTGLNTFKGIRYAAPPTGSMRWQPPHAPTSNRNQTLMADAFPPRCPQSGFVPQYTSSFNFTGDEDCLFLSVYAPSNASNLPVLVWIHGGGYGLGQGTQDLTQIINTNKNGFIGVAIQYRLGAFGFMSSDEIHRYGTPNAGILDQTFALQWVQSYIDLFGGDPTRVTISGESAGAGSVMLQTMAFGGYLGDSLFSNAIAASPYLPMQYGYADFVPSQSYYAFAQAAGCFDDRAFGNASTTIFQCLVGKDTMILQNASSFVSASGTYGTWGFLPVTDGAFIQQLPSQQLLRKQINGVRILSGNNANEGPLFTPQNIATEDDFVTFLRRTFPLFTESDISKVLLYYPSTNASVDMSTPDFATSGVSGATALNESTFGTGQQQRADNVYSETTFTCPAYWLAEAFSDNGHEAYKYQHSVIGAQHGADVAGYFGPATPNFGPDYEKAFMTIWGNFIIANNPSLPLTIANGASSNSTTPNPATTWPLFTIAQPYQINLNETGGTAFQTPGVNPKVNITEFRDPGLRNDFSLVNAYTWEGGRGLRCDFWRSMGVVVPE